MKHYLIRWVESKEDRYGEFYEESQCDVISASSLAEAKSVCETAYYWGRKHKATLIKVPKKNGKKKSVQN